jgi:uncharacterized membrane protein YesL
MVMTEKTDLDKYRPRIKFSELLSFTTSHPGLAVFLVYATVAIAGFIYLITFYSHFNLEVTEYLEITDILVAGIKDPLVMLMVLGAFSMVFVIWAMVYVQAPFSAWLDKKFNKGFFRFIPYVIGYRSTRSFWWTAFIILTLYFYMFIGVHSQNKAEKILSQKRNLVSVNSEATNSTKADFSLLGTSINYVFLYNHESEQVLILPLESINSIQPINAAVVSKAENLSKPSKVNTTKPDNEPSK